MTPAQSYDATAVTLSPITWDNFDAVVDLQLEPGQEKNLPSNVYSIAESSLSPLFYPRAILRGSKVVGFVMYQFGEAGKPDADECTIWRFMIDRRHQNKRIGTAAMALVLGEIKAHQRCGLIDIYYDPANLAAKRLYSGFGFKEVGTRDDGDVIAEIKV